MAGAVPPLLQSFMACIVHSDASTKRRHCYRKFSFSAFPCFFFEHLKLIPDSLLAHRNFCPRRITPSDIDANPTRLLSQLWPVDGSEVENKWESEVSNVGLVTGQICFVPLPPPPWPTVSPELWFPSGKERVFVLCPPHSGEPAVYTLNLQAACLWGIAY